DLAACLVGRPDVLFLDEPTTGVDPASRHALWDLIRDLVDDGTTVVLTTQYLDEADRLAHRIGVINHGRLVVEGSPDELKPSTGAAVLDLSAPDDQRPAAITALRQVVAEPSVHSGSPRALVVPAVDGVATLHTALLALANAAITPT